MPVLIRRRNVQLRETVTRRSRIAMRAGNRRYGTMPAQTAANYGPRRTIERALASPMLWRLPSLCYVARSVDLILGLADGFGSLRRLAAGGFMSSSLRSIIALGLLLA